MNVPDAEEFDVHALEQPLPRGRTLIEASAGTGKTYSVAGIFLRLLLEERLRVEEILVTTFTIPATAELRERLRRVLHSALQAFRTNATEEPLTAALLERYGAQGPEIMVLLEAALQDFDLATIATIHGFCQHVLAECAFESGSAAAAEFVMDESELRRGVAQDFWRRKFYAAPLLAATAHAAELTPETFEKLLKLRLEKPHALVLPEHPAGAQALTEARLQQALDGLRAAWPKDAPAVRRLFLDDNTWAKVPYSKVDWMSDHLQAVAACLEGDCSELAGYDSLLVLAPSRILQAEAVKTRSSAPVHPFCELCEELHQAAADLRLQITAEFLAWAPGELMARKTRANVISFSDLLLRLHAELCSVRGEELGRKLRLKYRAALIDEFQDTDPVQAAIFERAFGSETENASGWLFLIGDPKQAIYSFRGADVFSYLEAARRAERKRTLRTNYRSTQALVTAVNTLFTTRPDAFVVPGIGFENAHSAGRQEERAYRADGVEAPLRLWCWQPDPKLTVPELHAHLAQATAAEITRLLAGDPAAGGVRVPPEQVAVITSTNAEAALVQAALRRAGIPAVALSTSSVFATPEAADFLALLWALAQPADECRFRAALLTSLLGGRLSDLRRWEEDERAWERWRQLLLTWHFTWQQSGLVTAWRRVLREGGVRSRLATEQGGKRRLTNLAHLAELAQAEADERGLTPAAVAAWVSRHVRVAQSSTFAREEAHELRLESDEPAVRVITAHKSKGLEYDYVFCPFSWRNVPKAAAHHPAAAFHRPDSIMCLDLAKEVPSLEQEKVERWGEEVRLLYVALTRARLRCDLALPFAPAALNSAATWLWQAPAPAPNAAIEGMAELSKNLSVEAWRAHLEELSIRAEGTIALVEIPSVGELPSREQPSTETGSARTFEKGIERDFVVSSFTSLTRGANPDVPEQYLRPAGEASARSPRKDDIHSFPAGARAGVCLHEIFEQLEFTDSSTLEALVEDRLRAHAFDAPRWTSILSAALRRVLELPLAPGFRLGEVAAARRLVECEFHLPAGRLIASALPGSLFGGEEHGMLEFKERRGWLKGYIDLVFQAGGRFYLADWKSNRLGSSADSYQPPRIRAAMQEHHYPLQAHLYALALHRYLSLRQPGYRFEEHFGGMFYFFVRGVDPAHPEAGVWHERPSLETILRLEKWLEGAA